MRDDIYVKDARHTHLCILKSLGGFGLVYTYLRAFGWLELCWCQLEGKGRLEAHRISPGDKGFGVNRKYLQGMIRMPWFNSNGCAQHRAYVMLYDYIQFSSYLLGLPCHGSTLDNQSLHSLQGKWKCSLPNDGHFYRRKRFHFPRIYNNFQISGSDR